MNSREIDERLLVESIKERLAKNKLGKGVSAEEMPKLLDGWIRGAKRRKRARK